MKILPPGRLLNYSAVILNYAIRIFHFIFAQIVVTEEGRLRLELHRNYIRRVEECTNVTLWLDINGAEVVGRWCTGGKENSFDLTYRRPSAKHNTEHSVVVEVFPGFVR